MQRYWREWFQLARQQARGFTLVEMTVAIAVLAIGGAIAIPTWLSFLSTIQLNMAQDQVFAAMQQARTEARRKGAVWQVSFRQVGNQVQWTVHPAESGRFIPTGVTWTPIQNLDVLLDVPETTLDCSGQTCSLWRAQFNQRGHANGQLGRITLRSKKGGKIKRCVFVSTLIGTLRTAQEQSTPDETKRYCY